MTVNNSRGLGQQILPTCVFCLPPGRLPMLVNKAMRAVSPPIQFGTDGWRAIVGKEFTFENVERVAQAYADLLKEGARQATPLQPIPLGYDRRFLSDEFAKTFASVLAANGIPVLLSQGYCPTPCISWMTKHLQAPGGVTITASHNPFPWNGIKFKESYGGSASPELTDKIEERIVANLASGNRPRKIPFEEARDKGHVRAFDPRKEYVQALRTQLDVLKIQQAQWKIAYDPLFGAGAGFLPKVLELPVREIHEEHNPSFGGLNPEPIEKNLFTLMNLVKKESFDVGLATDGDADRIGAVDELGRFVNPHQIFSLILKYWIERGYKGDVVKTVSTTGMIDRIAARHGLTVHETPIGFKYICQKFLTITPLAGGEESGGIAIPGHVYERDGLLSALLLLEIMSVKKKKLGELLVDLSRELGPFHFEREDLHLPPDAIAQAREKLSHINPGTIGPQKVVRINRMDGTKLILENESWLLIRPSGTEPVVRIYAEASDPAQVRRLILVGREMVSLSA